MIESFAIHTAVLVGLIVTWLWTERLGGVFAGFAVPGYLGAIALVAPASSVTLLIEAVLTYAIVWGLGEGLARLGLWSRVFGRERFLLFVIVSVPVRLLVEGLAAGGLQQLLGPYFPDGAGDGFFSVGLVLVPLLANTFWKPGLVRGLAQVGTTTALTVVLLLGLVMPVLGLSFSSFFLSFEDIALAFVAVPKVYVILICTAVIATWTAERFGYNAGGLLVPALLGLLILEPTKLITTVVEIIVLTVFYRVVTSLPGVRGLELAGSRRLVVMYLMAWVLKLLFAWLGQQFEIPIATWNLYGFGYLLSSLVAVRCLDVRPMGRVLLPMGFNIGAGAGIGLLASVVLGVVLPERAADAEQSTDRAPIAVARSILHAAGEVRDDAAAPPSYVSLMRGLPWRISGGTEAPDPSLAVLPAVRSDGTPCPRLVASRVDATGVSAWWCGGEGPILVLPAPLSEPDTVWLGARLLDQGVVSGLILIDVDVSHDPGRAAQALRALRRRVVSQRVLVLTTGASSRIFPAGNGASWPSIEIPDLGRTVPMALGEAGPTEAPWWDELRATDAVLVLDVDAIEAALPAAPTEAAPWGEAAGRDLIDVDPRSDFVVRLAAQKAKASTTRAPVPAGVAWSASTVGLRTASVERGWIVEEREAYGGFGRLLLRPGATSDHVLIARRAADELGTAEIALRLAEDLDAAAVWSARRRARGLERMLDHRLDAGDAAVSSVRAVLRTGDGVGRLVSVRQLSIAMPDPPVAVLAEPREGLRPLPSHFAALVEALDDRYPGWERSTGRRLEPGSTGGIQPMRYVESLERGRAVVLWVREDLVAEAQDARDYDALVRWYGLQGVSEIPMAEIDRLGVDRRRPVDDRDGLLDLIAAHFQAPTLASVQALRARGDLSLITDEIRVSLALRTPDRLCIGRAGASEVGDGLPSLSGPGCWAVDPVRVAP